MDELGEWTRWASGRVDEPAEWMSWASGRAGQVEALGVWRHRVAVCLLIVPMTAVLIMPMRANNKTEKRVGLLCVGAGC